MFKKILVLLLTFSIFFISCSSSTVLQTVPPGAKVYINDEYIGVTPCVYQDTKIVFSNNYVRIEKEGYKTFNTSFSRDEEVEIGAIVSGVFFIVPFLWTLKYKPYHNYELIKLSSSDI